MTPFAFEVAPVRVPATKARVATCRKLVRMRRTVVAKLGAALSNDPNVDMLLELYLNEANGCATTVTSLCAASHVPESTAIRLVRGLHDRALIERQQDRFDRRRCLVTLTNEGRARLEALFDALSASS
jgi:DNA-binding MarR family transcriptional regulator